MPLILGKDGVNRELKEVYLGVGGINKQEKELYLGKGGVNKQIYTSELLRVPSIYVGYTSSMVWTDFAPCTPNSVEVTLNKNSLGMANRALFFRLSDSSHDVMKGLRINVGDSRNIEEGSSERDYTVLLNYMNVATSWGGYGDTTLANFKIEFNATSITAYLNGVLMGTKTYSSIGISGRPSFSSYSAYMSTYEATWTVTNLVIK